ncbi:hypothetical protein RhiirA4_480927 [Rhizophagus irregularis]|uniref:Uncharacterized protein n=1 Tax=Rhizophagus irregularis TaxID=588596 RepID=A0A2I1HIR7_9GLOM|nr:hypothetical protein RhiirA4_480927 [Rhizophagus irregularis]
MDLDSRAYSKLIHTHNSVEDSEEYIRIIVAIGPLAGRHNHEIPEIKILEENPKILSKNGYITMYKKLYEDGRIHGHLTNYIYCSICDFLVFIPANDRFEDCYGDSHLKRCISGNTISNEHARINEILQSIDKREFQIWQYKQYILQKEAKINCLHLEFFFQSTSHSEKNKLASILYDYNTCTILYEAYVQAKTTIVENTMPNVPNFEPSDEECNDNNENFLAYFTKKFSVNTIIYTSVLIEYLRTSPTSVATIYNITGWSNPLACFNNIQYSINGSGGGIILKDYSFLGTSPSMC